MIPKVKEQLKIAELCNQIGLQFESIKSLFQGKVLTANTFTFYSPEHKKNFEAKNVQLKLKEDTDSPNKPYLSLGGMNILEWFREKYKEISTKKEVKMNKGKVFKM